MKNITYLLLLFLVFSCKSRDSFELGTQKNPIKFYFTPSVDAETISKTSKNLMDFLTKETGYSFKTGIPTNYIAVVEAFGSSKADIAIINSFGYLLANEKYNANARLKIIRFGEDSYRGQIIANIASNIDSIGDLNGKRIAFTDASSSSGYLFPYKMMKLAGVEPSNTVFAMKHDNVVTMVYQGQVDAGATYYSPPSENGEIRDARARVKTQFPDVEQKVKIIAITEPIPNDPVVFRAGMPKEMVQSIIVALIKYAKSDEGLKNLKTLYNIEGFVFANDSDYDDYRNMLKVVNVEIDSLL